MAFCNSCGAPLTAGTRFCNKCGAAAAQGPIMSPPAGGPPPAPTGGGSSALKIVLIVVGAFVGLIILCIVGFTFAAYHFAKNAHVVKEGDHVKVETPFGSVVANQSPEEVAKNLGVDIYPGAEAQKEGSATVAFGNMRTATGVFHSPDPVDKICDFYKSRYPHATVTTKDQDRCSVVSNDQNTSVTVVVESQGGISKLTIANVTKNAK